MVLALHLGAKLGKVSSSGDKLYLLITPGEQWDYSIYNRTGRRLYYIRTIFNFQAKYILMYMVSF